MIDSSRALQRRRGFTLVELIVVIVLTGVLAGGMMMYFKPAVLNYLAVTRRASLSNIADGAVRLIATEIRSAVPNSIRVVGSDCVEFVPSADGGRYRFAPDIDNDAVAANPASAPIDMSGPTTTFDVFTPFTTLPVSGDYVVIGNQNTADVYSGANRGTIGGIATAPSSRLGKYRITLSPAQQFPIGYEGGRFITVSKAEQAVTYQCLGEGNDPVTGTGTGTLYRYSKYGFNPSGVCPPSKTGMVSATVATRVSKCSFTYDPNQGATQQSGYLQVLLELNQDGERAPLTFGVHVDNAP